MKKTLILLSAMAGMAGLQFQSAAKCQGIGNGSSGGSALQTVSCGTDTVRYASAKATGTSMVNLRKGDIEGMAQWFECPGSATVSGMSFRARVKDAARQGKNATVTLRLYPATTDSMPTGVPVTFTTLQIDTTLKTWKAPFLASPQLTAPYIVSIEYGSGLFDNDTIQLELNASGDGNGESLGAGIYNTGSGTTWLDFEHLISNPDRDAMLFPWVSYSLTTAFDAPGDSVCEDEPLLFQNASTGFALSRMYNRRLQNPGVFGAASTWGFGDGTTSTDINPTKTYPLTGTYSTLLTTAITGYHTQCSEPTTASVAVMSRPMALFTTTGNVLQQFDSLRIQNMSSGGTCTWDFGDGTPQVTNCSDQVHAFDSVGTFYVTITIASPYGCSETYGEYVNVQGTTAVEPEHAVVGLRVWPNPTAELAMVQWAQPGDADVQLMDLQGRQLLQRTLMNATETSLQFHDLPSGTYFLKVNVQGQTATQKVMISK